MKARYVLGLVIVMFLAAGCRSRVIPNVATATPSSTTVAPAPAQSPVQTPTEALPTAAPTATVDTSSQPVWQVETLLVAPGEPGRLYALVKDSAGPLWAFPASSVRLMISDDFAVTWAPFPGGLPVPPECMVNVNLDYTTLDALYASACQGLYVWDPRGEAWEKRSDQLTDVVAVAFGQSDPSGTVPSDVWAAAQDDGVIRSVDGGRTWQDASTGLSTFGGMANLGLDPRNNSTLYGIIRPKYAGSYLRRGTADGLWQTMPTPLVNATIETGMTIDGGTGALYVTTQVAPVGLWRSANPNAPDIADVQWELVHDFGANIQVSLLASGWSPQGLAIYANMWPLTPLTGGGASVGNPALYRSLDDGQTWQQLATP